MNRIDKEGASKLRWRYSGPNVIEKRSAVNDLIYIFKSNENKMRKTHINRLVRFYPSEDANLPSGQWHPLIFENQEEEEEKAEEEGVEYKVGDLVIVQYEPGIGEVPFSVCKILTINHKTGHMKV
jgi:hypothetical protein